MKEPIKQEKKKFANKKGIMLEQQKVSVKGTIRNN